MTLAYLWRERKRHPLGSRAWLKSWAKRFYNLPALLRHCWVSRWLSWKGASIGVLTVIQGAELNGRRSRLSVGAESVIGRAHIALHDQVLIGNNCVVNDGVTILTASHDVSCPKWSLRAQKITILDYAWIAQGATLLPGVTIGRGAVVGAGAVVTKSVPDYAIAVGNPAVLVEKRRATELHYSPVRNIAAYEAWLEGPRTSDREIIGQHTKAEL